LLGCFRAAKFFPDKKIFMMVRYLMILIQMLILSFWIGFSDLAAQPEIDANEKTAVIEHLSDALNQNYVFPDKAKEMSALLKKNLEAGKYQSLNNPIDFGDQLTVDLQSVSHDKHLRVNFNPDENRGMRSESREESEEEREEREAAWRKRMQRDNYGFKEIKVLEGNVGYLDLRAFMDAAEAGETATAAMNMLGHTEAIIIDLRSNGGGDPGMIQLLTSYLYGKYDRIHLNSFYFRPSNDTTQTWTLPYVPGTRNPDAEVFVLTSNYTFSAAEEFTYNLKNLERATIVGETTGGGAHPGGTRPIGERFVAFVPVGRAINPITNTNWEGTGVSPHVSVPKEKALKVAHQLAMEKLAEKAENEADKAYFSWYGEHLKAQNEPVELKRGELEKMAGNYGARNLLFEQGHLYYQREGRPKMSLLAIDQRTFALVDNPGIRFQVEMEAEEPVALVLKRVDGPSERSERTKVKP
jgi:hypothetical protein